MLSRTLYALLVVLVSTVLGRTPQQMRATERPVMKRAREPVIADQTDPSADHGALALVNVYKGFKMRSVKPGTIKICWSCRARPRPASAATRNGLKRPAPTSATAWPA